MRRVIAMAALALAGVALAAAPALAGKGGGGGTTTSAWVSASPNPAAAGGTRVEVTGCGYATQYSAEVRIVHSAGYTEAYGAVVWNTGCLHPLPFLTREAGSYRIEVYQLQSNRRKGLALKATTTLTVQ